MEMYEIIWSKYKRRHSSKPILNSLSHQYSPPSEEEIIQIQKQQILAFKNTFTKEQTTYINQIIGFIQPQNTSFKATIGKHIDNIEKWAARLYESQDYSSYKSGFSTAEEQVNKYQELLQEWQNIINLLSKYSNNSLIKKRIDIFVNGVKALEAAIQEGAVVDSSIISKAIWAGTTAKGYYLEEAGKEFLYDKLKKYGLETIQTGQMKSRRNEKGGMVDLAEDLIVIPKDKSIGQKTLSEFLQNVNVSTTIYLSDNEYQDLITQGIGIQAKASHRGLVRIKNTGASVKEYTKWADSITSIHADMLKALFDIANSEKGKAIRVSHPDYTAIANYILSHKLQSMLHTNAFYMLRDGLYDTYTMLKNELNKRNYVNIVNGKMHLINGSGTIGIRLS